jgi:hypothetical protein
MPHAASDGARKRARSARTNLGRSTADRLDFNFESGRELVMRVVRPEINSYPNGRVRDQLAPPNLLKDSSRLKHSVCRVKFTEKTVQATTGSSHSRPPWTPTKNFKSAQLIGARFLNWYKVVESSGPHSHGVPPGGQTLGVSSLPLFATFFWFFRSLIFIKGIPGMHP